MGEPAPARKVAEQPLAHGLRLTDHLLALHACRLQFGRGFRSGSLAERRALLQGRLTDAGRHAVGLVDALVQDGLGFVSEPGGVVFGLGPDPGGILFSLVADVGRGLARALEHPCRLLAERGRERLLVDLRVGGPLAGLVERQAELSFVLGQCEKLVTDPFQEEANLRLIEAAEGRRERTRCHLVVGERAPRRDDDVVLGHDAASLPGGHGDREGVRRVLAPSPRSLRTGVGGPRAPR